MPLYEYQCNDCGHRFEELVNGGDQPPPCPVCQSTDTRQLISLISARGISSGCATCVPSSCSSKFT